MTRAWCVDRSVPVSAGSMDVGEIAVLEDDGTLVVGGVTATEPIFNAFYATHEDEYDAILIHVASTFPGDVEPESGFAFFAQLVGFVGGINRIQGNSLQGSGLTRFLGVANMNDLPEYPADPNDDFAGSASYVELVAHEFAHAWCAFVQPEPGLNVDILGRNDAHWSFFLHHIGAGNASPVEGNRWVSQGGGTFETIESITGFAEIDEYLMGLRAPPDVSPYWVIDFPAGKPFDDGMFPNEAVVVNDGVQVDLTIQDIIDGNGPRGPDASIAPKRFKVAYVLVIPQGTAPSAGDLSKMETFRLAFEQYFAAETEGLGAMDTRLSVGPGVNPAVLSPPDDFESGVFDPNRYEWWQGTTISELGMNPTSGTRSMRMNGNWGGGDEVRSVPVDLSGRPSGSVSLVYSIQRTGGGDSPESGDDVRVEYSNSSGNWVPLAGHFGNGADETTFTQASIVVPDAGLHDLFRFRLRRLQGEVGEVDDYFVDDLGLLVESDCPWDCGDGDGTVGTVDFLELLGQWGQVGSSCDFDGGGVATTDFLALLGAWGACP